MMHTVYMPKACQAKAMPKIELCAEACIYY